MGKIEKSDLKSGFGNQLRLVVSEGRAGQGVGVGSGEEDREMLFFPRSQWYPCPNQPR